MERFLQSYGVAIDSVSRGENAEMGAVYREMSQKQLEKIEGEIDFVYCDFLAKVMLPLYP